MMMSIISMLPSESGRTDLFFECNQFWTVSWSGSINGMSVFPIEGKGKGKITVSYDTKYSETSLGRKWNENGTIFFHI